MLRRHQLAVLVQQALGAEHEHRVVERPGRSDSRSLTPIDRVDPARAAHRRELVDQRPRHVDRAEPHPLPQLVGAAERRRRLGPRVRRVQRDEALGQHRQLGAGVRRLAEQPRRLGDAALGVEDLGRRLDRGDPDAAHDGHAPTLTRYAGLRRDPAQVPDQQQVLQVRRGRRQVLERLDGLARAAPGSATAAPAPGSARAAPPRGRPRCGTRAGCARRRRSARARPPRG